jgi:hypothetical protein
MPACAGMTPESDYLAGVTVTINKQYVTQHTDSGHEKSFICYAYYSTANGLIVMDSQKQKRTWRNSARVNLKVHLFVVLFMAIAVLSAVGLSSYLFHVYFQHILMTLNMWGALSPRSISLVNEMFDEMLWLGGIVQIAILFCIVLVALNYVFKITGAEHALSRHIREKLCNEKWESVHLRKGDALTSISHELNKLSEQQAGKNQSTP